MHDWKAKVELNIMMMNLESLVITFADDCSTGECKSICLGE